MKYRQICVIRSSFLEFSEVVFEFRNVARTDFMVY